MSEAGLSGLEYHVLLAMAQEPRYGYAIKAAVESDSAGAISPRAGSLYRVLSRLMSWEFVTLAEPQEDAPHPGRPRKYYALTARGREALKDETRRLKLATRIADDRLGTSTS